MIKQMTPEEEQAYIAEQRRILNEKQTAGVDKVLAKDYITNYGGNTYGITDEIGWYRSDGDQYGPGTVTLGGSDLVNLKSIDENSRGWASEAELKSAIDKYASDRGLTAVNPIQTAPVVAQTDYSAKIDEMLNSLMKQKSEFTYDPESDPVFQAYKEQYGIAGDRAMTNTMAQASAMTGGRTNSWAVSAGQQAKGNFDQQLMARVPELANAAYGRSLDDLNNQYRALQTLMTMDSIQYDRGRDTIADQRYEDEWNYSKERDTVADERYQTEWDHQLEREEVADTRYDEEFTYQQQRDLINDDARNRQIGISAQNAALSQNKFDYQKERDIVADERYEAEQIAKAAEETGADENTLGPAYNDMMSSEDPKQWLIENSPYMTDDELKALEKLTPDKDVEAVINAILNSAE